jgi:phospholipase C
MVASIVNAIGDSSYRSDTAITITSDDWGGWYDHVALKVINSYEYGFRVPLLVVSPYGKAGYISHVTHDFGSVLKFFEEIHGLPSLGSGNALADNLPDCFKFKQTPLKFQPIPTALNAEHFLSDRRLPKDPDDN